MTVSRRGFLLIDKPRGVSSYGVVDAVRRTLAPGRRQRGGKRFRCGHAGTLDPLATGLLMVLCGPETRLSHFLLGHDKRYRFTARLGATTDTLDTDGDVVATGRADFTTADIEAVLTSFQGEILQIPPIFSALKRGGKPLYELARGGAPVPEPEARPVRIDDLSVLGEARPGTGPDGSVCDIDLSVSCSSGTYVRSLARDIAESLGSVGHVLELRRTRIGPFEVADALPAARMQEADALIDALRPAAAALPELPTLRVDPGEAADLRQGVQPDPGWLARLDFPPVAVAASRPKLFCILDAGGDLVAVGHMDEPNDTAEAVPRLAAVFPPPPERAREDDGSCD